MHCLVWAASLRSTMTPWVVVHFVIQRRVCHCYLSLSSLWVFFIEYTLNTVWSTKLHVGEFRCGSKIAYLPYPEFLDRDGAQSGLNKSKALYKRLVQALAVVATPSLVLAFNCWWPWSLAQEADSLCGEGAAHSYLKAKSLCCLQRNPSISR